MFQNVDTPGMSYTLSELGIPGNPNLPVLDSHRVRGGAMSVAFLVDRNDIPQTLRKANVTRCYVEETGVTYVLRGGTTNANWIIDGFVPPLPTLEVGEFVPTINGNVGTALNVGMPANLFKAVGGRAVTVVGAANLPPGVQYDTATNTLGNVPTEAGRFLVVVNGQDSDGNKAQNLFLIVIGPSLAPVAPVSVGSAAMNIVMTNTAETSIVLTTAGYAETGLEAFAVVDATRRFIGGSGVETALFLGSSGYANNPSGIGYFSFAWNVNLFRSRYPAAILAEFDVYVHPSATSPDNVNRVNYSYQLSDGIQAVALVNSFDYAYRNQATSQGGFWGFYAGSGNGQQNTAVNLNTQFAVLGNVKKKIGTFSINLITGVSGFAPIAANPAPVVANAYGNRAVSGAGVQTLTLPANTFYDTDALTWTASGPGAPLPNGITFDGPSRTYSIAPSVANGDYPLQTTVTDTALQSATDPFVLTVSRVVVPPNPAPVVANPFGNRSVSGAGVQTLTLPANTFYDTDALTWTASGQNSAFPTGLTFDGPSRTYSVDTNVPNGNYSVQTIATDTIGQAVADLFVLTVNRATGGTVNGTGPSQMDESETPGDYSTSASGDDGTLLTN